MLLRESDLTFERIAHEWARELDDAKKPGRLNRDEIFLNMVCGVWRGQFANTVLTIEQAFRDDKDGQKFKPLPLRVTRETLDKVVVLRPGVRPCDPDASRWDFWTERKLHEYEPLSLRTWFEPLTISKEDFGRWCDEQGYQRPTFWGDLIKNHQPRARPAHRPPLQLDNTQRALCKLYPTGVPSNLKRIALVEQVNEWLKKKRLPVVSKDTITRALKKISDEI